MFVQANTLQAIKAYYQNRLAGIFSDNEIKLILKSAAYKRLNISDQEFVMAEKVKLSESDLLYFRSIVKRLIADEPAQYILGETEFYGLQLKTDQRALIPRPETEELVHWIAGEIKDGNDLSIADFCSGSGCIALALKSVFPGATVYALELSAGAIELIQENSRSTKKTLEIMHIDVLGDDVVSNLTPASLDIIVSNPPYIGRSESGSMSANVLKFEPEMALFVEDEDPLIFYRKIARDGKILLKPNGALYFEINENFGKEVAELLNQEGFVNIELRKDLQGKDRMIRAKL